MQLTNLKYKIIYFLRQEHTFSALSELKTLEKSEENSFQSYKNNKIKNLLDYSKENIEFYFKYANRAINLDEVQVLDKTIIRNDIHKFMSKNYKVDWRRTSGTTGYPLVFPKDKNATAYMDAMMYCVYSWHDILIGDKQARIWGRELKTKDKFIQHSKDLILNRNRLSAFEMSEENCLKYFKKLLIFKPKYFYAYSNALYQFALVLENNKLNGRSIGAKVAICTGEILFPHQREKIAEIFGCKVVNEYGSTENGIIGFECEYGKMHLMPTISLEIFKPDENGFGQIVLTELNSRSMPFIRYKIGDIGRKLQEKCKCKRPYELIEIKEGRVDDYIRCPDGRQVYDAILAYTLKESAKQFKAYQESIDCLKIYLVPNNNYNSDSEAKLRKTLMKYLGGEMNIIIFLVEEIPFERSGKFRYFVSNFK